ncbi:MAG: hypothetical protein ACRDLB_14970 [Actinomycetota bacterium]
MRKAIGVAVVVGALVIGMTTAHAGKRWTAEAPYGTPAAGGCADGGGHNACGYYMDCGSQTGCAVVQMKKAVRAVNITVIDDSGLPTRAEIYAPGAGKVATICAASDEPVFINGAAELWVHAVGGTCADSTPSVATKGIVRVTPASR